MNPEHKALGRLWEAPWRGAGRNLGRARGNPGGLPDAARLNDRMEVLREELADEAARREKAAAAKEADSMRWGRAPPELEAALAVGEQVLKELGISELEARETIDDVRRRDDERLTLQLSGGLQAGRSLMRGNMPTPQPAPYIKPRREGRLLNEDAVEADDKTAAP